MSETGSEAATVQAAAVQATTVQADGKPSSANRGWRDLFNFGPGRDFWSMACTAVGVISIMWIKSICIAALWNQTMPRLAGREGRPFFRKINWQIALGLLALLSLLCVKPL